MHIICFGPGPRFKGGIAQYNTSLARALHDAGAQVTIVSWTQQYPAIIPREFLDRSSTATFLEGYDIPVHYLTNWNAPWTWLRTAKAILALRPDKVIIHWYNTTQGLPLAYIAGYLRAHGETEVIFDLHAVEAKERSSLDAWLSRRTLRHGHRFLAHARKSADELIAMFPEYEFELVPRGAHGSVDGKPVRRIQLLYHPIYTLFRPDPAFDREAWRTQHGLKGHVFLFFGFIRKYKGLHQCIAAFARLAGERPDASLLIVGERFWRTVDDHSWSVRTKRALFNVVKRVFLKRSDDEGDYDPLALIDQLGIGDRVVVVDRFIANEQVPPYFQASDAVVLFYETAMSSGVEMLGYNFGIPALATRVGHFPETITDGRNGYLANAGDVEDMVRVMKASMDHPIPPERVMAETRGMSWENYAQAVIQG
jgi:glycosyltransferase involved in cell wall biosynthesis